VYYFNRGWLHFSKYYYYYYFTIGIKNPEGFKKLRCAKKLLWPLVLLLLDKTYNKTALSLLEEEESINVAYAK